MAILLSVLFSTMAVKTYISTKVQEGSLFSTLSASDICGLFNDGHSDTHREPTGGCQGGDGWQRDRLGVWVQQIQTIQQRMNKQQGPTVQHRELYSISRMDGDEPEWKIIYERMYVCIYLCVLSHV